jgi:hypothetical protein
MIRSVRIRATAYVCVTEPQDGHFHVLAVRMRSDM